MAEALSTVDYSIGYLDSGHGHTDGLEEVELENADGLFQSSLEANERGGIALAASKALEQNVIPSDPTASFANVSLHNMPGNVTWPIVAVSYIYGTWCVSVCGRYVSAGRGVVPAANVEYSCARRAHRTHHTRTPPPPWPAAANVDQTAANETGPLLRAFMEYMLSDEGQSVLEGYNFVGIPSDIVEVAQRAINRLDTNPNAQNWTFEYSDSTQKGTGQEDYVISAKRRSYYAFAIGENEDDIANLQTDVGDCVDTATLTSTLDSYATTDEVNNAKDKANDGDDRARRAEQVAAAAVVLAIIAILACVAQFLYLRSKLTSSGALTEDQLARHSAQYGKANGTEGGADDTDSEAQRSDVELTSKM